MGKKIKTNLIHDGSDPQKHYGSINSPIYKNSTLIFEVELFNVEKPFVDKDFNLPAEEKSLDSGLRYLDHILGTGEAAVSGKEVVVHYSGYLADGTKFDSSYDRKQPSTIPLNRLIPGWSVGIQLMNVGSTFQFFIPGHLAYGREVGPGGPMATLIFQVELLEIIRQGD